jgi:SAM-dependent methyltransferase
LYRHRNLEEAENFINRLFVYLTIRKEDSLILDLACGKGRHAIQVNKLGYNVVGMDLSEESINSANRESNDRLHFLTADMRNFSYSSKFDLVLNLFTSFGYFKTEGDNQKVLNSISKNLNPKGLIVLDYLNINKSIKQLPTKETIKRDKVSFKITKRIEDNFIIKDIDFDSDGEHHQHQEFVKIINLELFKKYFENANLSIIETFGDYNLNPFDFNNSDRLILIAKKND